MCSGVPGVTMIAPRWQAVSGARSTGYTVEQDHYVFKGVYFKRAAMDKKLKAYGLTADSVCMSFLLSKPQVATSGAYAGKVREVLKFAFIDPVAPVDIVLPHPDWFNAKMAKAVFSAAATKKAGTTVPPFFRPGHAAASAPWALNEAPRLPAVDAPTAPRPDGEVHPDHPGAPHPRGPAPAASLSSTPPPSSQSGPGRTPPAYDCPSLLPRVPTTHTLSPADSLPAGHPPRLE